MCELAIVTPALVRKRRTGLPAAIGWSLALVLGLETGVASAGVEHAAVHNHARGATAASDSGPFDQVNLFNGNLLYAIFLGQSYPVSGTFSYQLALHYNSLVWDFEVGEQGTAAHPARGGSAGVGWDLSLGRLHGPSEPGNTTGRWVFVAPDGGLHRFYDTLQPGQFAEPTTLYTRDGTYLQLVDAAGTKLLRFPDGQRMEFRPHGGAWRLVRSEDRHGRGLTIEYSAAGDEWTLIDDQGRRQILTFAADPTGTYPRLLAAAELSAFNGTQATYSFTYTTASLSRPAADDDPSTPGSLAAPLLSEVVLPDGTRYAMTYHGPGESSGLLHAVTLPTLGRTEWTYEGRQFPWLECTAGSNRHLVDVTGVASRTLIDRSGAVLGTWSFQAALDTERPKASTCDQPRQLAVTVTTPLGHQQLRYFSVYVSGDPINRGGEPWRVDDYALPLTKGSQDASGLLLSRQILEGGTALESVRVAFEQDAPEVCTPACVERNARLTASRFIYHDDGDRYRETVHSGFDGFGQFAVTVEASNFPGETPRTRTAVYSNDAERWLLGLLVERRIDHGSEVRRTRWCLDGDGEIVLERRLAAAAEGPHDLVTRTVRDGAGNPLAMEHFGGDVETLATSADLCNLPLGGPQYRQETEHVAGTVRAARWVGPGGETVLTTIDHDVDASTGRVAASRDAAGLETTFSYDSLGRLTEVVRPQHFRSTTVFTAAGASAPARETTTHRSFDGSTVLTMDRVERDGFGRVAARETKDFTGAWAGERYVHDAMGNRTTATDALGRTTQFLDFDPYGRARRVLPPQGAAAPITYAFAGIRTTSTTQSRGHYFQEPYDDLVEIERTSLEVYDGHGRPVRSEDPDGSIRRADYDPDGRLTRVTTESALDPETTLSERRYDGRGLLIEETDADGQSVQFAGYDALGRLTRVEGEDGTTLREFDRAGRLVRVAVEDGPTLKELVYATANDPGEWGAGRLRQAVRYNYGVPGLSGPLRAIDHYVYAGPGGRPTGRTTTLRDDAGVRMIFATAATYDELGQSATVDYPQCDRSWHLVCVPKARTVSFARHAANRRYLKKVTSQHNADPPVTFVHNTEYFADGTLKKIVFSNPPLMYQVYTAHPDHAGRYHEMSICTAGSCDHFRPIVYDSSGQLTRYRVGPVHPDDVKLLPTGLPEPATSRAPLADLRATLDDAEEAPGCPTRQRDALGQFTRSDACPGSGGPGIHFYVYDAFDRLVWRAASYDGTSLASIGHRWHLFDLAGRAVREHEKVHPTWSWIRDSIYRDGSLVGWVESYNASESAAQRHFVHVDPFGAPFSKHRVENGVITGWTQW